MIEVTTNKDVSDEMRQTLLTWGCPRSTLPDYYTDICIHDLVEIHAKNNGNLTAIHHTSSSLTYKQLNSYANKLANRMLSIGIKKGDKVAVLMDRTPSLVVAMLATFKIGAIYVPINPSYPDERIHYIQTDSNPKLVLINNENYFSQSLSDSTIYIDHHYASLDTYSDLPIKYKVGQKDTAYVIYTSGTTGQPKGVLINHYGLINLSYWYKKNFELTPEDRASQFASQGFDTFFCETIPFLANSNTIYIIDDHDKLTPSIFIPWLIENKISICDLPTAYAQMLFTLQWPDTKDLRIVKIGGESITKYPSQIFNFDIWNSYGPTEATIETTFIKIYQSNTPSDMQPMTHLPPPIGKPIDNCEIYIVDTDLNIVPVNTPGELLIGGAGISQGYLNRPDLTAEKFVENTISSTPGLLYKSGDLAKWLPDGNIEYLGRIDSQVKIRGYRIEIEEIKTRINQLSDVKEAVVIAREHADGHKSLVSYLVPDFDKIRIPLEEPALVTINNYQYKHATTINYSKQGMGLAGISEKIPMGSEIKIYFKPPDVMNGVWFSGSVVWQVNDKIGVRLILTEMQKALLNKSVEYFLSQQQLSGTICNPTQSRNLYKALEDKLPDFMIPSKFIALEEFPITVNGKVDTKSLSNVIEDEQSNITTYQAPTTETEKVITQVWSELLHHHEIGVNDNFFELGGNSLLASRLSILISDRFNLTIPVDLLFNSPYVSSIANYIDSNGKDKITNKQIKDSIEHDLLLDPSIRPTRKINVNALTNPDTILLTGAAGFLGIHVLRSLLKQTSAVIYCLIRKGKHASSSDKLMDTVKYYQLDNEISLNNKRIVVISGDLNQKKFGLSSDIYSKLTEHIDTVYHCAAEVHMLSNYTKLRSSNVTGTNEIIRFATSRVDKPIHFISTLSAANIIENNTLIESEPDLNIRSLTTGYAISKWICENLISQIKKRGLKTFTYRLGNIFGQSNTGITNLNDFLLITIKGCIQMGYAPNWNQTIHILPVDFVSNILVAISQSIQKSNDVFHIDQPNGILWTDLISWLNEYGFEIKLCTNTEWQQKLLKTDQENALFPFIPYFLTEHSTDEPSVSILNTRKCLDQLNINIPAVDDTLLTTYFNKLCEIDFIPQKKKNSKAKIESSN